MQNFKRCIASILLIALFVTLFSAGLIQCYYSFGRVELDVRKKLSGTIDVVASGASHIVQAFNPQIIDQELNCNSYALAESGLTMQARYDLLQKELARNPVKLVIIDISSDTLTRDSQKRGPQNDIRAIALHETRAERLEFMRKTLKPADYVKAYSYLLYESLVTLGHQLIVGRDFDYQLQTKGHEGMSAADVSQSDEELRRQLHSHRDSEPLVKENLDLLVDMIELCKQYQTDIIFVVVPVSENFSTQYAGMDDKFQAVRNLSAEYDIPIIDFNLLIHKKELFPDVNAFVDPSHMSEIGASTFSKQLSEILLSMKSGENIEKLFYDSYEEKDEILYGTLGK